jgi:hypothetical protein
MAKGENVDRPKDDDFSFGRQERVWYVVFTSPLKEAIVLLVSGYV